MDHPKAWLEFASGHRVFLPKICTVGRSADNQVAILSERVSRRHAVIRQTESGAFTLMDMGSSNGTYLNGQRLTRSTELQDSWVIEIGSEKMTFRTPPKLNRNDVLIDESREGECWLLVMAAAQRGCRTSSHDIFDKTFENWSERCQRMIAKFQGRTMRGAQESLLAFWPRIGDQTNAAAVAMTLRSLRTLQKQTEEFRFALHYGAVRMRRTATGDEAPVGSEVIVAIQIERLASSINCPVLITEGASKQLGATLATQRLPVEEARGYRGSLRLYTPAFQD